MQQISRVNWSLLICGYYHHMKLNHETGVLIDGCIASSMDYDLSKANDKMIQPPSEKSVFGVMELYVWGDVLTFDNLCPIPGRPHSISQSLENIGVGLSFCFKFFRTERRYSHPWCIISNIWIYPESCSEDVLAIQIGNFFNQFNAASLVSVDFHE